jgi:hypothetical protein
MRTTLTLDPAPFPRTSMQAAGERLPIFRCFVQDLVRFVRLANRPGPSPPHMRGFDPRWPAALRP